MLRALVSAVIQFLFYEVSNMRETLALALFCLLVAVLSFGVVLWVVVDATLEGMLLGAVLTLDGLLLIAIGLLIGGMFGFCFLWLMRDARLWEVVKNRRLAVSAEKNSSTEEKPPANQ